MIRVLIADDEAPARAKIRRLLSGLPDLEIAAEAASGPEAVAALRSRPIDLVFLDVQMPGLDGFEVIREVGVENMPAVVFVTAHDEHALKAFDVHALDYLLKPFAPERFRGVLERARNQLRRDRGSPPGQLQGLLAAAPAPASQRFLTRIWVQQGERATLLPVERIRYIRAERNYARLFVGAEEHLIRSTIASLASRLDPGQFLRISRSEIVRLDAIKEMHAWSHGDYRVILTDGSQLTFSRRYRAASGADFHAVRPADRGDPG